MGALTSERTGLVGLIGLIGFRDVRGHGLPPADTARITTWRTGRFPSGRRRSPGEAGKTGDCSEGAHRGRMVFQGDGGGEKDLRPSSP